ncbi:uncharacterized protein LOC119788967 isoform X2 [Cyprinodon tularosa]|uniref:uncharacterized protein LOC119788967 isoform X2 n=1 Tax=Cyprinodon tularosa TaxID=77115 RepID=UPI0018E2373E|nr:uncharacterized protein LOC119788967 isoform X2 [Cyprinodon tularosa]
MTEPSGQSDPAESPPGSAADPAAGPPPHAAGAASDLPLPPPAQSRFRDASSPTPEPYSVHVSALDGKPLSFVTHTTEPIELVVSGNHHEKLNFFVFPSPQSPVVLGHPWLSLHNPHLNWREGRVESWSLHCLSSCLRSAHVFLLLRCRWVTSPPFFHQKKGRHPLLQFNIIFDAASVFGNRLGEPCIEPLNRIGAMLTGNELLPLPTALETSTAGGRGWLSEHLRPINPST